MKSFRAALSTRTEMKRKRSRRTPVGESPGERCGGGAEQTSPGTSEGVDDPDPIEGQMYLKDLPESGLGGLDPLSPCLRISTSE